MVTSDVVLQVVEEIVKPGAMFHGAVKHIPSFAVNLPMLIQVMGIFEFFIANVTVHNLDHVFMHMFKGFVQS
jgi:hypothetical protein